LGVYEDFNDNAGYRDFNHRTNIFCPAMETTFWEIIKPWIGEVVLLFGGGIGLYIKRIFRSRAEKQQEQISVGKEQIDLVLAEKNLEKILDEADKAQMKALIDELAASRIKTREAFAMADEANARAREAIAKQNELEIKMLHLTRRALIAETNYKHKRCDVLDCCNRRPPVDTEELDF
jgi:hypothetical protein